MRILNQMTRMEAEIRLRKLFKLEKFHDLQWQVIHHVFAGKKTLLIEKTGFGKSLCYQFPATQFDGLTIVFSPLIALMRDQVNKLNSLEIAARCINSAQSMETNAKIIAEALENKLKILFIAPERQENYQWLEAAVNLKISFLVIDEAHCISTWGHDFRPSFRRIIKLVKLMPIFAPVLAVTATATIKVQNDIQKQISADMQIIRGALVRPNLQFYQVRLRSQDEKLLWLGHYLPKFAGSGLIYTGTRKETEKVARWLQQLQLTCDFYHAGLEADKRIELEKALMNNTHKCIVSTNALGMGIDKPDIRFIIHTQIPQSPIHYYQEIGRAGRDGKPAKIILLFCPEDDRLPRFFIEAARPAQEVYERVLDCIQSALLNENAILRNAEVKANEFKTIKADLIEQAIIRQLKLGSEIVYEYIPNSQPLDFSVFERLKEIKREQLKDMLNYTITPKPRMQYLCEYLGDKIEIDYKNCDNTELNPLTFAASNDLYERLSKFKSDFEEFFFH